MLREELLAGAERPPQGSGRRIGRSQLAGGWADFDRDLWAVEAKASAAEESASGAIGPPGFDDGCWTLADGIGCLEVDLPPGPPLSAVRVFEASGAGGVFAIAESERILWCAPAERHREPTAMLEIALPEPRSLIRIQIYARGPVAIDAVAGRTASPIPPRWKQQAERSLRSRLKGWGCMLGCGLVLGWLFFTAVVTAFFPEWQW